MTADPAFVGFLQTDLPEPGVRSKHPEEGGLWYVPADRPADPHWMVGLSVGGDITVKATMNWRCEYPRELAAALLAAAAWRRQYIGGWIRPQEPS